MMFAILLDVLGGVKASSGVCCSVYLRLMADSVGVE